jgi:hypothetical protein
MLILVTTIIMNLEFLETTSTQVQAQEKKSTGTNYLTKFGIGFVSLLSLVGYDLYNPSTGFAQTPDVNSGTGTIEVTTPAEEPIVAEIIIPKVETSNKELKPVPPRLTIQQTQTQNVGTEGESGGSESNAGAQGIKNTNPGFFLNAKMLMPTGAKPSVEVNFGYNFVDGARANRKLVEANTYSQNASTLEVLRQTIGLSCNGENPLLGKDHDGVSACNNLRTNYTGALNRVLGGIK